MAIINESSIGETQFQKILGHHHIYKEWNNLANNLEKTSYLSAQVKEEIRRMLAQKNHCQYCKAKGKPRGIFGNEKEQICIGLVEVYMKVGDRIPHEIIQLLKQNLTKAEIVELFAFISFTNCQQQFGALMKLNPSD
ncbi:carboxymuconolactone decarboxylase family protein [Staphylococcus warneri]|jgi:alkylhydroperoxidase family enzyme|uniref:Alkylhydroperoxidase n=1 Tax=Staphylococcus warneri TaxID=1292 RepID=A0A2T4Q321_STAWA|nr:hypothetical protein [Staphylococcus warneri]EEQ78810.1 hypothetical protein STAWA0001_0183 [Staphylococcus warneri L37603]MBO0376789.1 carboxymuconolactone decarboxylase family protein [Staphylococcus warneri]MCD8804771.1 carboxymuconolactone decarboxylase family protein [Staphylococcus warneri]MCD8807039.1 carboxymuconolactone decarboxylase family protein [Staphylococcus warneri]MCJ1804884.1 carboxymuconolactone decarboxylase family protein [Staphylococcus warneri]